MRYYAQYGENGKLQSVGIGNGGTEITLQEYEAHLHVIKQKVEHVNNVLHGTEIIEQVPAEWREEVQRRVDAIKAQQNEEPELTAEEALSILLGGDVA